MDKPVIVLPHGKIGKKTLTENIRHMYLSGDHDPLEIEIKIKGVEDAIADARKDSQVQEVIWQELDKYPDKTIELHGAEAQKRNTKRFDLKSCDDPVYNELLTEFNKAKAALKDREDFLKGIKGEETLTNPATGEIVTVKEPYHTESRSYAIKHL